MFYFSPMHLKDLFSVPFSSSYTPLLSALSYLSLLHSINSLQMIRSFSYLSLLLTFLSILLTWSKLSPKFLIGCLLIFFHTIPLKLSSFSLVFLSSSKRSITQKFIYLMVLFSHLSLLLATWVSSLTIISPFHNTSLLSLNLVSITFVILGVFEILLIVPLLALLLLL